MKIYIFRAFCTAGLAVLMLSWLPATVCLGAPITNTIGWTENFTVYTNLTPLINGTNGWYASSSSCIVQTNVRYSSGYSAMVPTGETLSNSFVGQPARNVKLVMYIQPQLSTSSVNPNISTNVAAQFFINSSGYFVVGSGNNWIEATNMASGAAQSLVDINNTTNFVQLQIHLQYNTHTWDLKAWTNGILVTCTNYLRFSSNLNSFCGFTIYGGTATGYVDDISVTRFEGPMKVNGMSFDTIRRVNGALPDGKIDDVKAQ